MPRSQEPHVRPGTHSYADFKKALESDTLGELDWQGVTDKNGGYLRVSMPKPAPNMVIERSPDGLYKPYPALFWEYDTYPADKLLRALVDYAEEAIEANKAEYARAPHSQAVAITREQLATMQGMIEHCDDMAVRRDHRIVKLEQELNVLQEAYPQHTGRGRIQWYPKESYASEKPSPEIMAFGKKFSAFDKKLSVLRDEVYEGVSQLEIVEFAEKKVRKNNDPFHSAEDLSRILEETMKYPETTIGEAFAKGYMLAGKITQTARDTW